MELIKKKVSDLIPYINNSRTHSEEQITQLISSIKEFGFTNPILLAPDNSIIAGHGRLQAVKRLGHEEVPCIVVQGLTKTQIKALIIADNQLALNAGWDLEKLSVEIEGLKDEDFNIDILGFEDDFIKDLLNKENEGLTDEDAVPEILENPKSKLGDLWLLGSHRLLCDSSTNIDSVNKLMNGTYPDLIHTDPPYGMNAVSKSGVLSKNYKTDILGDNNADIAKESFKLIYSLYPESKQIWWGANYYCSVLPDSECWLVWDKDNGQSDQTDCELAWANFRSVVRQFTQSSEKKNRVHPTQKPVSLMEWIIKRFKIDSKTLADFFGGSGSTLIAGEKHNLQTFIMELDPKYCDVIIQRWQQYTGKEAIHEQTGKTYNSI
jgi:DNA modification methylase